MDRTLPDPVEVEVPADLADLLRTVAEQWVALDLPPGAFWKDGYASTRNQFLWAAEAAWFAADEAMRPKPPDLPRLPNEPVVYRLFDPQGRLLYIGSSGAPLNRLQDHRRKAWGHLIWTVTAEPCPTLTEARVREAAAIRREQPCMNVVGRRG